MLNFLLLKSNLFRFVEGLDAALHVQELQVQLTLTKAMNSQDQFWREKAKESEFYLW